MTEEIEFKIARLDLRPGDVLVLKVKNRLPSDVVRWWTEKMKEISGGHRCIVLEGGADLAVLTAAEIERRSQAVGGGESSAE